MGAKENHIYAFKKHTTETCYVLKTVLKWDGTKMNNTWFHSKGIYFSIVRVLLQTTVCFKMFQFLTLSEMQAT